MYIMSVLPTKIIILCSKYWISQNLFQNLIRYISDIPDISDISDIYNPNNIQHSTFHVRVLFKEPLPGACAG